MKSFEQTIKDRVRWMSAGIALIVMIFVSNEAIHFPSSTLPPMEAASFAVGFRYGIAIGIQILLIRQVVKYQRALRNPEILQDLEILEKDERRQYIQMKMGGPMYSVAMFVVAAGALVASYVSWEGFMALLLAVVALALIKGSLKLYYRKELGA